MHDASPNTTHATHGVRVVFDWNLVRDRCHKLYGATTNKDCAPHLDIPHRTLTYFRSNPAGGSIRTALQIRAKTGLSLDDMFPMSQDAPAALTEAA